MFSTDARRGAPGGRSAARPLSTLGVVGVAGATAALVFGSGVYLAEKVWTGAPVEPGRGAATASSGATERQAAAEATTVPARGEAGAASAVATEGAPGPPTSDRVGAAPSPQAAPTGTPSHEAAAPALPAQAVKAARKGYGALKVGSAREATVYVTGVAVGLSNRPVEARCGRAFVRLGEPTSNGTRWLGAGRTVVIRCDALTEAAF